MSDREFIKELAVLINRHSAENGSNTPDFILADYLYHCMCAFEQTSNARELWYGGRLEPGKGWQKLKESE